MDINEALKLGAQRAAKPGASANNELIKDVQALPTVSKKTAAAPAKVKVIDDTPPWRTTPVTTKPVPPAVQQVMTQQPEDKDTRLALRDTETGEFVSTEEAIKHPETVATDYISTNAKPAVKKAAPAKKAVKKVAKLPAKAQKAVVKASAAKPEKVVQKVVKAATPKSAKGDEKKITVRIPKDAVVTLKPATKAVKKAPAKVAKKTAKAKK
ncbi:hypothetical protein LUCX_169 [Xanthomonas phage vB_XciM_LucasX]|nr:hypothetical protein LUCX_169 [Xanthomonas phage vB_XciM_LucasX]